MYRKLWATLRYQRLLGDKRVLSAKSVRIARGSRDRSEGPPGAHRGPQGGGGGGMGGMGGGMEEGGWGRGERMRSEEGG